MFSSPFLQALIPLILLLIAVVSDLRFQKIHNKLILILLPLVLLASFLMKGFLGLQEGLLSFLFALVLGVALNRTRFIGGGDLKLMCLLAFLMSWQAFCYTLMYAFLWASLLGIFKIIFEGNFKNFLWNLFYIFKFKSLQKTKLHTLPFSVGLFFGWLTYVALNRGLYGLA